MLTIVKYILIFLLSIALFYIIYEKYVNKKDALKTAKEILIGFLFSGVLIRIIVPIVIISIIFLAYTAIFG